MSTVVQESDALGLDTACFSPCRTYRYELTRGPLSRPAVFVMLNPSTADAFSDDPTIRRCRGFARAWGCVGLVVVNAFALRSTDPAALRTHVDPVGPANDDVIRQVGRHDPGVVVVAWGVHGTWGCRDLRVLDLLRSGGLAPHCLGTTGGGQPRHPLYVRGETEPEPYGGP